MCVVAAGCTGLLTREGPLTKFMESPQNSTARLLSPSPLPVPTTPATTLPETPEITVTPTEDPYSYNNLRVIPQPEDTVEYRTFNFRYRTVDYSVRLPVNTSILHAANASSNKHMIIDSKEVGYFYQQMTDDPAIEPFYSDILKEIRKQRFKGGRTLTDDEYLEFLVSFVQQIPYDNTTTGNPRYPVEVIYDAKGDCDEKSILLTGLLSREDYDVGLLIFPSLEHATAGIRIHLATNKPSFRVFSDSKRDYVYIETTTTRLIGFYDDEYEKAPAPIIVPVGKGKLLYGKVNYVMSIFYDIQTIKTNMKTLEERGGPTHTLYKWDYDAYVSYVNTYNFVMSTNDRVAAMEAIRESELPHNSACMSCT
ncbi:MAG: hypothetical protein OS112_07160 [Methanoregula sp.]|nr:MAG: hypothetical protein OS112_07160 [Methanoregula sp.]